MDDEILDENLINDGADEFADEELEEEESY